MADEFNAPIGGDLSAAEQAAKAVAAAAREAELSVNRARKAGDKLDEQEVKREAARKRVRDRPYSEPGGGARDLEQELEARKKLNAELEAEAKRAAANQQRIAAAHKAEMERLSKISQYRVVDQAPSGRVRRVTDYAATEAEARAIAAKGGGVVQENPKYKPFSAAALQADRDVGAEARVASQRRSVDAEIEAARATARDAKMKAAIADEDEVQLFQARRQVEAQQQLVAAYERKISQSKANGIGTITAERQLGVETRSLAKATAEAARLEGLVVDAKASRLVAEQEALSAASRQAAQALGGGLRGPVNLPTGGGFGFGGADPSPSRLSYVPFGPNPYAYGGSAGGGGSGPPPPPPPGGPPKGPGGGSDEPEKRARATSLVAAEQEKVNRAIQRNTAILNANQNAQRSHGALTTEFINAAVRGESSYREWGYQIGATAAKFAGWTLVSVPVFAAIDGVRKIGQGAIAASTGVNQLQRVLDHVDAGAAQGAFRDLSQQFNVPIESATQAVYLMGQRFHDLPSAVNAAKAVLYSFKTGDVSIEESAKNLTAVINGFGLSADQLLPVFDRINQAQNQFGVSINDTEQGLAKSAGAYRNAGGSIEYLTSLIAAAKLATGRTGQNVGTAIQRSVGFIQRPSNQSALEEFGIDPTQGIDEVYTQAFAKAKHLQGEQLQQLATALSSPQYASYFVPILQNYANSTSGFAKIKENLDTSSAGSAAKELNTVLGSIKERISEIGNEMQRVGSGLAEAGAGLPFGAALHTLDAVLTVSSQILDIFNKLPDGVTKTAIGLGEAYGLLRLMRRTGVGQAIGDNAVGRLLSPSPQRQATIIGRQAFRENAEYLQAQVVGSAQSARTAHRAADLALRNEAVLEQNYQALQGELAGRTLTEKETQALAEAEARLNAAVDQSVALAARANAADQERLYASQALAEATATRAAFEASRNKLAFLESQGTVIIPDPNRATEQIGRVEEGQIRTYPTRLGYQQPIGPVTRGGVGPAPLPVGEQRLAEGQTLASRQAVGAAASQARIARNLEGVSRPYQALGTAYLQTGAAFQGLRSAEQSLNRGLKGLVGQLGGLGSLNLTIGGALLAYEVVSSQLDRNREQAQTYRDATKAPVTKSNAQRQIEAARKYQEQVRRGPSVFGLHLDSVLGPVGAGLEQGFTIGSDKLAKAQATVDRAKQALIDDARALAAGKAREHVGSTDVLTRLKDTRGEFKRGALTIAEYRKQLDVILREAGNIKDSGRTGVQSRVNAAKLATAPPKALVQQLFGTILGVNAVGGDTLDSQIDAYGALVSGANGTGRDINGLIARATARLTQLRSSPTPELRGKVDALTQDITQSIQTGAQAALDQALLLANSEEDRTKAYDAYVQRVQGSQRSAQSVARKAEQSYRAKITAVNRQLTGLRAIPDAQGSAFLADPTHDEKRDSQIKALSNARKRLDKELDAIGKQNKDLARALRALIVQANRTAYQDQEAITDAQNQVTSLATPAGLPRAQLGVRQIGAKVQRAIRVFGRGSAEVLSLIAQQQQAQQEVVQEQVDLIGAKGAVAEASAGTNQIAAAGSRINTLQQQLSVERAHPEIYKSSDVTNLQAQIISAQNDSAAAAKAAAEEAKQKAEEARQAQLDNLRAQYELAESTSDDPVRTARLEYELSKKILAKGGFQNQAEKLRDQATVNKNRRTLEQARSQSKYDDIEFYSSIGKYTSDQELRALRDLEKTLKGNKQLKRTIQQRIYALTHQDSGSFDVDVGNITLPTTYEIRRAVLGGRQGSSVTNQNTVHVSVSRDVDLDKFGAVMEQTVSGSSRSIRAAAGVL